MVDELEDGYDSSSTDEGAQAFQQIAGGASMLISSVAGLVRPPSTGGPAGSYGPVPTKPAQPTSSSTMLLIIAGIALVAIIVRR